MQKIICFDLEGPLSPQDNAFEVIGLVDNGHSVFEAISRYDDLLTLENRPNYEPGDTLALIVPFLVYHGLSEQQISDVSAKAVLVDGAKELIAGLKESGWIVYIISTSYEQHAHNIGAQLSVEPENIHCTRFPLTQIKEGLSEDELTTVGQLETALVELSTIEEKDEQLKSILDDFYRSKLKGTGLGDIIENMNVVGGQRKVDAARLVAEKNDCNLSDIVVVGDSITDFKMLQEVHKAGGLAVAFNANSYAVPYATISLASESLNYLRPVIDAMHEGGRSKVKEVLGNLMNDPDRNDKYYFHDLEGLSNYDEILEIHNNFRSIVRGKAAKLG